MRGPVSVSVLKSLISIAALALVAGPGCRTPEPPPVVVTISAATTSGLAPLTVPFSATVSGGAGELSFHWTFGDGSESDERHPVHVFESADTTPYLVVLTVSDASGGSATASLRIAVATDEQPTVAASATPTAGPAPHAVDFSCAVAGGNAPVAVRWAFGDGDGADVATVSHTYVEPGVYRATCFARDADGDLAMDTVEIQVVRRSAPEAFASASPTAGRAPLTVSLEGVAVGGDGDLAYHWDLGDGSQATGASVIHTYTAPGTYAAVLSVTDQDGDRGAASVTITVDAPHDVPTVTASATPLSGQAPHAVAFDCTVQGGNAPVSVVWSFGNGATAPIASPSHTFADPGLYTATCQATDADGDTATDSVTLTVYQNEIPYAAASASPAGGRAPLTVDFVGTGLGGDGTLSYAWSFGDGQSATGQTVSHVYSDPGVYAAVLTVTDEDGDSASATVSISVTESGSTPQVTASATPESGVAPLSVALSCSSTGGNAPLSYRWDFGDGGWSTTPDVSYVFAEPGTYTATCSVTDADGDRDTDTVTLTVAPSNEPPIADAVVLEGACSVPGNTLVKLDASASSDPDGDPLQFTWSFVSVPPGASPAFNDRHVANPTFVPPEPGPYAIRVFVSDGLHTVASDIVTVEALAVTELTYESGDGQTGTVGEALDVLLGVRAVNACGTPAVKAAIVWRSVGGALPSNATTVTGADGRSENGARLGTVAGPQGILAELASDPDVSLPFSFMAEPGPAIALYMDEAPLGVPGQPQTLTFRTYDAHRNLSPADLTFDVWAQGHAEFDGCGSGVKALSDVAVVDGLAELTVCSDQGGDTWLHLEAPDEFQAGGWHTFYENDFEESVEGWSYDTVYRNDWGWGEPSHPGVTAHSGSRAFGTALHKPPYEQGMFETEYHTLGRAIFFDHPGLLGVWLEFWQYRDMPDAASSGSCTPAATVDVCGTRCARVTDGSDNLPPDCPLARGWTGASGGWVRSEIDVTDRVSPWHHRDFLWTFWPGNKPAEGAGWYIDDVRVHGLVDTPIVRFDPGEEGLTLELLSAEPTVCEPAVVLTQLWDFEGNPSMVDGMRIQYWLEAGAYLGEVYEGTCFGSGSYFECDTEEGRVVFEIVSDFPQWVEVEAITATPEGHMDSLLIPFSSCDGEPPDDEPELTFQVLAYGPDCDSAEIRVQVWDAPGVPSSADDLHLSIELWSDASFGMILDGECLREPQWLDCTTVDGGVAFEVLAATEPPDIWIYAELLGDDGGPTAETYIDFGPCDGGGDPPGDEEICLSGEDEDRDGFTDCEDDACWPEPICTSTIAEEPCEGPGSFPFACRCVNDEGCDAIGFGFICHTELEFNFGEDAVSCAPPCTAFADPDDYCQMLGYDTCDPGGRCVWL